MHDPKAPEPPFTLTDKRWWPLAKWAAILLIGAGVTLIALATCGCAGLPATNPDETVTTPYYIPGTSVPVWSSTDGGPPEGGALDFIPSPWGKVASGVLALVAMLGPPRMRENSVGAVKAALAGDGKDALLHLAALTPLVHTPKDVPPGTPA